MPTLLPEIITASEGMIYLHNTIYALDIFIIALILIRWNSQTADFKWLAVYYLLSLLADGIAVFLYKNNINPNYGANFFGILSLPVFLLFSYHTTGRKIRTETLIVVGIIHFIFSLGNFLFVQQTEMNSYTNTLNSLIIIVISILFFFRLLVDLPATHVFSLPLFWIMSSFFFTHAGKLVIHSVRQYFLHYLQDNLLILWSIHNFLSLIGNLLILYGVWLKHRQLKSIFSSR